MLSGGETMMLRLCFRDSWGAPQACLSKVQTSVGMQAYPRKGGKGDGGEGQGEKGPAAGPVAVPWSGRILKPGNHGVSCLLQSLLAFLAELFTLNPIIAVLVAAINIMIEFLVHASLLKEELRWDH
jgi:hypothetical protein